MSTFKPGTHNRTAAIYEINRRRKRRDRPLTVCGHCGREFARGFMERYRNNYCSTTCAERARHANPGD